MAEGYKYLEEDTWRERYFSDISVYRFWYLSPFKKGESGVTYNWIYRLDVQLDDEKLLYEWIKFVGADKELAYGMLHFIEESKRLSNGGAHTIIAAIFNYKHNDREKSVMLNK